jgi:multiple sugar transport system substrate-binding protein
VTDPIRPTRRQLLGWGVGAAAVAAASAVAGCSSPSASSGAGQTQLTFLNWEETKGMPLGEAITEFEKQNPDITVVIQPAVTGDAYDAKMRTVLAGNNPPDIFRINDDYVQEYTDNGTLLDLAPFVKQDGLNEADFAKEVFNFGRQDDGRLTSWQLGFQPAMVFYNKDMFKAAGVQLPPTTWTGDGWHWEDFLSAAQKLTKGQSQYGAIVSASTNYEQTFSHNNGSATGIYSADGKGFTLADPKGIEAVQWVADLTCKAKVQPPWAQLLQANANVQLFAQGKAAMVFERIGSIPYLRQTIKSFDWDIAPPPAGSADQATEASVICFGVPKKAKNHDAAWKLLSFLGGATGGQIVAKGGSFAPVNIKAAESLYSNNTSAPAHSSLLGESAKHLTATSRTTNTSGARQIYRPALDAVYNCRASASDALSSARAQVEQALSRG